MSDDTLRKTPLHDVHEALGGKLVPFAGWAMPVQYRAGIQAEHRSVREAAGLFDVSHMGEFELKGPDALALLQKVAVNDASALEVGQAQYSALCHTDGTVVDDLLVYRRGPNHFLLVVNAANVASDFEWIESFAGEFDVILEDQSDEWALLALQGPRSQDILQGLTEVDLDAIGYYRFDHGEVAGQPTLVARTGYTGEDGFELYVPPSGARAIWDAALNAGAPLGLIPCGLGARDTLRLEVGYPLYGNDLDREHSALESMLGWIVKFEKGDFVGREALLAEKEAGVERRLVGLKLTERGFPRPGYAVVADGTEVGQVTSGTSSPSLGVGIALARVEVGHHTAGTELAVRIRSREVPAEVTRPPFWTEGSIRR